MSCWQRSFSHEWLHYQILHFLTFGQGNGITPSNYTYRNYLKLCWTAFQHLIEISATYTLWYAISEIDCFDFFSLLSSCCLKRCVQCFPGDNFLICKNCLFFRMIIANHLRMASWFWYHWLVFTEIGIFCEIGELIFHCRFINKVKRLEFILRFKIYWFFRVS